MGTVSFKGEIVYTGPVDSAIYHSNWNDSMAMYYPYISVRYFENNQPKFHVVYLSPGDSLSREMSVSCDDSQVVIGDRYDEKVAQEKENSTIRVGKKLQVIKGRKIQKGTIGECFWFGDTKFGKSVGIVTSCGKKQFTSASNVKVVTDIVAALMREVLENKE